MIRGGPTRGLGRIDSGDAGRIDSGLTINEQSQKQRSQSPKLLRLTPGLTIVSAESKIYSPRQGYVSPGNSIILEIAATLLFIGVTI